MRVRFYRPESRVYTATVEPVNADRQVLRPQDGETDVRFFRRVVLEAFLQAHRKNETVTLRGELPGTTGRDEGAKGRGPAARAPRS